MQMLQVRETIPKELPVIEHSKMEFSMSLSKMF